jgi:hypothetical protein
MISPDYITLHYITLHYFTLHYIYTRTASKPTDSLNDKLSTYLNPIVIIIIATSSYQFFYY